MGTNYKILALLIVIALALVPVMVLGLIFVPGSLVERAETIKSYEQDRSAMQRIAST